MAEYLLRARLPRGMRWTVGSAGVAASDGFPASAESILALREKGIDLMPHRSRALTRELVDAASAIVVMTAQHRATILERFSEAGGKVFLIKSFDSAASGVDVEDPIGMDLETYRSVRDEIDACLPELILFLHETGKNRTDKGRARA